MKINEIMAAIADRAMLAGAFHHEMPTVTISFPTQRAAAYFDLALRKDLDGVYAFLWYAGDQEKHHLIEGCRLKITYKGAPP